MTHEAVCLRVLSLHYVGCLPLKGGKGLDILNLLATGATDSCKLLLTLYVQKATKQSICAAASIQLP